MDNQDNRAEAKEAAFAKSPDSITQIAMAECWPGGPIVSNPKDCKDYDRDGWRLTPHPNLQLSDLSVTKKT